MRASPAVSRSIDCRASAIWSVRAATDWVRFWGGMEAVAEAARALCPVVCDFRASVLAATSVVALVVEARGASSCHRSDTQTTTRTTIGTIARTANTLQIEKPPDTR